MNKHMKRWIALALAIAVVAGARYFSAERQLKASEGDGTTTAAEQQAEVKEETKRLIKAFVDDYEANRFTKEELITYLENTLKDWDDDDQREMLEDVKKN